MGITVLCTPEMINDPCGRLHFVAEIYLMYGLDEVAFNLKFSKNQVKHKHF